VENLLHTTGVDLQNGGVIPELEKFQDYLKKYRIVMYGMLTCEEIMFDGMVDFEWRFNLLQDEVTSHYQDNTLPTPQSTRGRRRTVPTARTKT
jgi:hypothetical protein